MKALIATGTDCAVSSRLRAVTTMSDIRLASASCAWTGEPIDKAMMLDPMAPEKSSDRAIM
ncbi:hypothetical protein ACFSTI_16955 [Rhizorhabdus histidinilytica]